jgi:hypothetical protein
MRYCTCDRGKQLEQLVQAQITRAQVDLLQQLLARREKASNGQLAKRISVKKIEAELQRLREPSA